MAFRVGVQVNILESYSSLMTVLSSATKQATHTAQERESADAEVEKAEANMDRKDSEFEKPLVVNVDALVDSKLNVDQREQLKEIMRQSQMKRVRDAHDEADGDGEQDADVLAAKRVMRMAAVPSQTFIGMEPNRKPKRKIKFKANSKRSKVRQRENGNADDDSVAPQAKKRKIYQEMDETLRRKHRAKKLKFKNTDGAREQEQTQTAMLSFDPDEE